MTSSTTKLFGLPEELILITTKYLSGPSLKSFSATCKDAWRIACPLLQEEKRHRELYIWERVTDPRPTLICASPFRGDVELGGLPQYNELLLACENGDTQLVSRLLKTGVSASPPMRYGAHLEWLFYTPLEAAVHSNNTEIVKMLLAADAELPFQVHLRGRLICNGRPDDKTIKVLLDHGFDSGGVLHILSEVLGWACQRRGVPLSIMEWLIKSCHDVNAFSHSGSTPLGLVLRRGTMSTDDRTVVIRMLVQNGANVNTPCDYQGSYPLHEALSASTDAAAVVKQLLHEFDADPNVIVAGDSPLRKAVRHRSDPDIAKLLLDAGAQLDLEGFEHAIGENSPSLPIIYDKWVSQFGHENPSHLLGAAAAMGDIQKVENLFALLKGDELSGTVSNIGLALNRAKENAAMDRLISLVLTINAPKICAIFKQAAATAYKGHFGMAHSGGCAKLARAALRCAPAAMNTILNAICDVIPDDYNNGVKDFLCIVVRSQNLDAVRLVLGRLNKPASYAQSISPNTPLNEAIATGNIPLLQAVIDWFPLELQSASSHYEMPLAHAVRHSNPQAMKALMAAKTHPYVPFTYMLDNGLHTRKSSVIQFASAQGYADVVKLLLEHSCNVNTRDEVCERPILSWASQNGHIDVVKVLLAHNPDITATDSDEMDALAWAARNDHADIVKLLLAHGSDINRKDERGCSVLWYAAYYGNLEMTRLLLEAGADAKCISHSKYDNSSLFLTAITGALEMWKPKQSGNQLVYGHRTLQDKTLTGEQFNETVQKHVAIGRLLLEWGAPIEDNQNSYAAAPLFAIEHDLAPILQIFLDRGAVTVNQVNGRGKTPLHIAVEFNSHKIAQLLVTMGADVCRSDADGNTHLHGVQDDQMVKILYGRMPFV